MRNILILIGALALSACSSYTVQNNMPQDITVNDETVLAGKCARFSDSFLSSDYPLTIVSTVGEVSATENGEESKSIERERTSTYSAGHYVVEANGSVNPSETACDKTGDEAESSDDRADSAETAEETAEETASSGARQRGRIAFPRSGKKSAEDSSNANELEPGQKF